jgi:hypothetical protein
MSRVSLFFNIGYDVVLISDATASSNYKHYESTLENVKGYYGLVMDLEELSRYLLASAQQPTQILRTDSMKKQSDVS